MRINKFVALATGMSRRTADKVINSGRVLVNGNKPEAGFDVATQTVTYDGKVLALPSSHTTILFNKPAGYVCSRNGQGSRTVYDLLPPEYHNLKPIGRLDKDSSGLLLLTDDGELAHRLTHPSFHKEKVYEVVLDRELTPAHIEAITRGGVRLDDGPSRFGLTKLDNGWQVSMYEGRNRQIRRTFAALGYSVVRLHRVSFGTYTLGDVEVANFIKL